MRFAFGLLGLGLAVIGGFGLYASGIDAALAADTFATDYQLGLQEAATPVMRDIASFHNFLLWIITAIAGFVLLLLVFVLVRFNARANPTPSRTTHNTLVEVAWTVVPILILIAIAVPSFRLLYLQRDIPAADMTVKAIGNQWYWTFEYPDHDNMTFDAIMLEDDELQPGQPRLLAVDNDVVVPVDTTVRVIVTATDVIHNFAMPAFGLKMDAIPGRLNETWFRAERTGIFYGQCSELCGIRHAFMPAAIRVVTAEEFDAWLAEAREKFASNPPTQQQIAATGGE